VWPSSLSSYSTRFHSCIYWKSGTLINGIWTCKLQVYCFTWLVLPLIYGTQECLTIAKLCTLWVCCYPWQTPCGWLRFSKNSVIWLSWCQKLLPIWLLSSSSSASSFSPSHHLTKLFRLMIQYMEECPVFLRWYCPPTEAL
jgi:hypothetical protein